jgi:hypothetical protein
LLGDHTDIGGDIGPCGTCGLAGDILFDPAYVPWVCGISYECDDSTAKGMGLGEILTFIEVDFANGFLGHS